MKNIKQAADEYAKSMYNESDDTFDSCKEDFMAGIRFAQRFIPVEEELPENEHRILVQDNSGYVEAGHYDLKRKTWAVPLISLIRVADIVSWRPINHR